MNTLTPNLNGTELSPILLVKSWRTRAKNEIALYQRFNPACRLVRDEPPIYSTSTTDFKIRTEPWKLTTRWESGEDRKPYTGSDANGALAKRRRNAAVVAAAAVTT
jgi:hypothetical protein